VTSVSAAPRGGSAVPPPAEVADIPRSRRELPRWLIGTLGIITMVVVWQILAATKVLPSTVPTPTAILSQYRTDGWSVYWLNIQTTVTEAAKGWLWGNAIAIVLAILFVQVPFLERGFMKFAVAAYCIPVVALGPLLAVLYGGDTPKVVLAAFAVFFATLISMLVGLKSADATSLDLVRAYGGGSLTTLRKVRLHACLPSLFAGLRIAWPAAVLGAVIGEYIGGTSGLGVFMIAAETGFKPPETWGIALVIAAIAGIGYGLTALAERILVPWAPRKVR
jgi:ABC-type nitrate/sulfonate/bicarbonate transport system permease component